MEIDWLAVAARTWAGQETAVHDPCHIQPKVTHFTNVARPGRLSKESLTKAGTPPTGRDAANFSAAGQTVVCARAGRLTLGPEGHEDRSLLVVKLNSVMSRGQHCYQISFNATLSTESEKQFVKREDCKKLGRRWIKLQVLGRGCRWTNGLAEGLCGFIRPG